jgi:FAD/FMN-containing dehydrogenase
MTDGESRKENRMATSTVDQAIEEMHATFRGELIHAGTTGYDEARKVYNAMIDRRPAIIARCADAADVIAAVNYAREHDLLLAVRGGGHHGAGLGVCDDGMVIDLSLMKGVRVDPDARTALVMGGSTWGEVDHATHPFGLVTPSGIVSTTGVGGLTLGGGVGHNSRRFGLAIDHLLSADMVLADGSFVTVSEDHHPDLFWAIRGGGGNFGVVTAFQFRLDPLEHLYAGPMFWDASKSTEVLSWYREFLPAQPDEVGGFFGFHIVPPSAPFPEEIWNRPVCIIVWSHSGTTEQAEAFFAPIREKFGTPLLDWVGPMPLPTLQGMFDALYPPGMQWYWKADFVNEISDEALALNVEFGSNIPTWASGMHLYPIDGAASRVSDDATAWNWRGAKWCQVMAGISPDPADRERITNWSRSYWEAVHPYSAGGAYVNMMMEEGQERVQASYGANYDRLAAIKAKYDPGNLFRMNQNIRPAAAT